MLIYMTVTLIRQPCSQGLLHFSKKAVVEEKTLGTSLTFERFSSRAPDVSLVQKQVADKAIIAEQLSLGWVEN